MGRPSRTAGRKRKYWAAARAAWPNPIPEGDSVATRQLFRRPSDPSRQSSCTRPPWRRRNASRGCSARNSAGNGPRIKRGPDPAPSPDPAPCPRPVPVPSPPCPIPGVGVGSVATPMTKGGSGVGVGGAATSEGGGFGRGGGIRTADVEAGAPPPSLRLGVVGGGGTGSGTMTGGTRSTRIAGVDTKGGASAVQRPNNNPAAPCTATTAATKPIRIHRRWRARDGSDRVSRGDIRHQRMRQRKRADAGASTLKLDNQA